MPPPPQWRGGRTVRAFSLIEVVVALTILAMITGSLFAILQGSVRGATQIEKIQRENDSINRFFDLLRKTFTTLPSSATLKLSVQDENTGAGQELTISGSPNCFGFGRNPISYKDTILGLRPDPSGGTDENGALLQYLCLSREDLIPQTDDNSMALRQETTGLAAPDEQGRYWMPLLPDVVQLTWRFYKEKDDTWLEEWDDSDWPDLIEVQLLMRDRLNPLRMVYSVPTMLLTAGRGTSSTNTSSSSSSNANSNSSNSSQGGGGGPGNAPGGGGRGSGDSGGGGRGGSRGGGPPGGGGPGDRGGGSGAGGPGRGGGARG
jgi:prepilin-type N-terminal cleavage/methylation domain-containing protein